MVLEKDGTTVKLENPSHIAAYREAGWTEKKPRKKVD
jgi:hypothetical protein